MAYGHYSLIEYGEPEIFTRNEIDGLRPLFIVDGDASESYDSSIVTCYHKFHMDGLV